MIRVQREDFDVGAEIEGLSRGEHGIGGVCAFVGLVRKDQTFDSPHNLKVQMAADCERAREILATARQRPKEIP